MSPVPVEQFTVTGVSFELAIIHWVVPSIAYLPETYTVNITSPIQFSQQLNGTTNITSVDDEYFVVLRNLQPNTQYFFQIISASTIGMTQTPNSTFVTGLSGMQAKKYETLHESVVRVSTILFCLEPACRPTVESVHLTSIVVACST